jgi:phosphosulfolactate phosphohydrolase-like enzyme
LTTTRRGDPGDPVSSKKTVLIDAFPQSAFRHLERDAIVCVDVISSATMLVTAVAQGRRAFGARSEVHASSLVAGLEDPLLCAELDGPTPVGFDTPPSPAALDRRTDVTRPLILFADPGTVLITNSVGCRDVYVACFRNLAATAAQLDRDCERVAVLGAGCRAEFGCEDQMAAAWIVEALLRRGFEPEDVRTSDLVRRWAGIEPSLAGWGNSAALLRRSGRDEDLQFILEHVNDLDFACRYEDAEASRAKISGLQAKGLPLAPGSLVREPAASRGTEGPVH